LFFLLLPRVLSVHYISQYTNSVSTSIPDMEQDKVVFIPSYVGTPESVRGIYMTSWIASSQNLRADLVKLIDDTELNAIVIDIKDYSGRIVFTINDPTLKAFGSEEVRIKDLESFIESLHKKGTYVIGRVAVFQDQYFVKHRPDLAVKNKLGTAVWKDKKGISWVDPGSKEYWDYIVLISKEARRIGFDEINFDYIRFPSDGNMQDISYPFSTSTPKHFVMRSFFEYLHNNLVMDFIEISSTGEKKVENNRLKISADIFGMVTTAKDDMGIGQLLEDTFPYFDYIMPMVYPSHYPVTFQGFKNPAEHPYEVVHFAMKEAVSRATVASTTTSKLRPWLQDFDLGADYGPAEVRAQIKATNDVGLNSWILWSPSNKYTKSALNN